MSVTLSHAHPRYLAEGLSLAVIGGRDFADYARLCRVLDSARSPIKEIVSGRADGADSLGARYALERGIWVRELVPLWKMLGKRAGMLRNSDIIESADAVVAFWDGRSKGTADSIRKAGLRGLPVHVVRY
jgi:hypothetical protein